jgi:cytochrome c oxidase subunit IV
MESPSYARETRTYGLVLVALLALTAVTVTAASLHFGNEVLNVAIALGIASLKASLVALFFMHLRHDKPIHALVFVTGLVFLAVLLALCIVDMETRLPVGPSSGTAPVVSARQGNRS